MRFKTFAIAVSALSLAAVTVAPASTKHHRHHARAAPTAVYAQPAPAPRFSDQPHMVQVRPGLWISSWDCIEDEGQGRWTPCSYGATRSH